MKISGKELYIFRAYELTESLQRSSLPENLKCDTVLWQCITDVIIQLVSSEQKCKEVPRTSTRQLSLVDENAIRYAGGYIIRKVLTTYKTNKRCGDSIAALLQLVLEDTDHEVEKESFLEYTRLWIEKSDRGGLFHISDLCYELFYEIELTIYDMLNQKFSFNATFTVADIENAAYLDPDIMRIWRNCSAHILSNEDSDELLCTIIQEWITMRGHSLANKFMEDYKTLKKKETKKEKGVRGELKK